MRVHDTVLYGVHGVCRIEDQVKRVIGGKERDYMVLKPIYDRASTFYLPADNEAVMAKLKRILSADEIYEMIRSMPEEPLIWIDNEHERHQMFQDILNGGDRAQMVRLIKTLYVRQKTRKEQKKNMLMSDERFMKDAERILYEEFAYVLKIDREQVLPFIMQQIHVEEK